MAIIYYPRIIRWCRIKLWYGTLNMRYESYFVLLYVRNSVTQFPWTYLENNERSNLLQYDTCCSFTGGMNVWTWVISDFHYEVNENCAVLDYHAASSGNFLSTFRDSLSFPFSRPSSFCTLNMRTKVCAETSVRSYHYSLNNNAEERSFHTNLSFKFEIVCFNV